MDQSPEQLPPQPWGTAIGLLVGCLTVLIGIVRGVSPPEIILRSAVAAALTAVILRSFIWLLVMTQPELPEDGGSRQ